MNPLNSSDIEVEKDVLGVFVHYPKRMHDSGVSERHFYQEMHKQILKTFKVKGPNPASVALHCDNDPEVIMDISERGMSDAFLDAQLERLERLAEVRESAMAAHRLLDELKGIDTTEARDAIKRATGTMADSLQARGSTTVSGKDSLKCLLSKSGEFMKIQLDRFFVRRGDLVFLAATPGSGKTTMALNTQDHLITEYDGLNVMFSMEMSAKEIYEKKIQNLYAHRVAQFLDDVDDDGVPIENPNYTIAAQKVEQWYKGRKGEFVVEEAGGLSVDQIRSKCLYLEAKTGKKLRSIVIDQLDKIAHKHRSGDSQTFGVKATTAALKLLANELQVAIICLVQISNKSKESGDKLFTMKDIFASSGPEQDGSQVWILQVEPGENMENQNRRTLITREKCRGGSVGFGHELNFDVKSSLITVGSM
jgi:replicative DNA helicase